MYINWRKAIKSFVLDQILRDTRGTVIYGDLTTNRLSTNGGTGFSNIYRSAETTPLGTTRPIMVVVADINTTLAAGTYWIQWQILLSQLLQH